MKTGFIIFIIIAAGILAYSNSLGNDFVWDDTAFVVTNDIIKDFKFFPLYFTSHLALANGNISRHNYRPLVPLSFAVDYSLWQLDPMGYHITNLVFHIANAILLFLFVSLIVKNNFVSLFTALIFLTHPVQTEAVSWISGRTNVLFLFFFLISLIMYIKYRKGKRLILYAVSLLGFLCALLSKEMAATLPFILVLFDVLYGRKEKISQGLIRYGPFFMVLGIYIIIRFSVTGMFAQYGYWTGDFYTTMLTMANGIVYYIRLLIFPVGLCADYLTFPKAASINNYTVLASIGIISGLLVFGFYLAKRLRHVSFSILWFFITLGPVMNIIPIRILIAERLLYLPIIGYAFFIAVIFRFVTLKFRGNVICRYTLGFVQACLIVVYVFMTIARNDVWSNEIRFCEDIIKKYPDNFRMRSNLSIPYIYKEKDFDRAQEELKKAIHINPDFIQARLLFARNYILMDRA